VNLRQIECFVAVAHHLSFTKAAADLGIAQPPLSQNVRRLEESIGASLFHRDHRRVELTDIGRAWLPRATALLQQAQIARSEITEMVGLNRAELRVGASGTLAAFLLPDLVAEFRSVYASINVHIVQQRSEAILQRVEAGELDIGLLRHPLRSTELEMTRLSSEPLFAALPRAHACADRASIPIAALRDDPFVMCVDRREPFYSVVSELCVAAGFVPKVICAGAEYTTVFRLVGMGLGVSVASELATRLHVEPSPHFVRLEDPDAVITTVMVANPRAERSEAASAFRAMVLKRQHTSLNAADALDRT
jgi:LysR family hydrogen peroxide-inducible transcriptional activator